MGADEYLSPEGRLPRAGATLWVVIASVTGESTTLVTRETAR
jgi:hypothetical protein